MSKRNTGEKHQQMPHYNLPAINVNDRYSPNAANNVTLCLILMSTLFRKKKYTSMSNSLKLV